MGIFEMFPYVNMHEMNLDWIIRKVKTIENDLANTKALNDFLGADDLYSVTVNVGSSSASMDKTFSKLQGAIKAGKRVVFKVNYAGDTYNNIPVYPHITFAGVIDTTTELSFTWLDTYYNDNIYRRAYAVNVSSSDIIELVKRDAVLN